MCPHVKRLLEAAKDILGCPYYLDEATIPKSQNLNLPQVVGNMSVAYLRYKELTEAVREFDHDHC